MNDRPDKAKTGESSDPRRLRDADAHQTERQTERSNGEPAAAAIGGAARGRSPLFGS